MIASAEEMVLRAIMDDDIEEAKARLAAFYFGELRWLAKVATTLDSLVEDELTERMPGETYLEKVSAKNGNLPPAIRHARIEYVEN